MKKPTDKLVPVQRAANLLHVPSNWLRAEAEQGRIPHLRAGARILVDVDAIERLLVRRAASTTGKEVHHAS